MSLLAAIHNTMVKLSNTINHLSDDEYIQPSYTLSGGSAALHTRCIINFFAALDEGYQTGVINYSIIKKSETAETSREAARREILVLTYCCARPDKGLCVILKDGSSDDQPVFTHSSYFRELGCLYEYALLHSALIDIAMMDVAIPAHHAEKRGIQNLSGIFPA
jgi:hypothetical protein